MPYDGAVSDADRLLALLIAALPGVAACAPTQPEPADATTKPASATTGPEPTTAVAPVDDPPPPGDGPGPGTDDGGSEAAGTTGAEAPAIEVPEGADYCFASAEAVELQDGDSAKGKCPEDLKIGAVREAVDNFHRRTGGPWDVTIELREALSSGTTDDGDVCCYEHVFKRVPGSQPMKGRLLADGQGRALLPAVDGAGSSHDGARAWLEDARMELASVASFARGALELMRLGAPSGLVAAYLEAARDEVTHARLCMEAARSRGARAQLGPVRALAPRSLDLAELAVTVLEEAALGETVAALQATRAARHSLNAGLAALQARIAADETRHAALAWRTLAWALTEGGAPVRAAVGEHPLELAAPDALTAGTHRDGRLSYGQLEVAQRDGLEVSRRLLGRLLAAAPDC